MLMEINVMGGGGGRMQFHEVTLTGGAATIRPTISQVKAVVATQKGADASANVLAWSYSGGVITLDSSAADDTGTYSVMVVGY